MGIWLDRGTLVVKTSVKSRLGQPCKVYLGCDRRGHPSRHMAKNVLARRARLTRRELSVCEIVEGSTGGA